MDFAAGVIAFPGGRVDEVDSFDWEYETDLLKAHAAARERTSLVKGSSDGTHNAGRLIAAAVREVAEECGIRLDVQSLKPWANWVTPVGLPKRFDTYFFVCRIAPDVEPRHLTTEATKSHWLPASQIFENEAAGVFRLLPPTLVILDELLEAGSVGQVLEEKRRIEPVCLRADRIEEFYRMRRHEFG